MMRHTNVCQKILKHPHRAKPRHQRGDHGADERNYDEPLERPIQSQNLPPRRIALKGYHQILAIASMTAISQLAIPVAQAEGVVFQSTIDAYEIGQIIESGQEIEIPAGAEVSIIDRDGGTITLRESTVYDQDGAPQGDTEQPSAMDVAVWNNRRAEIGGTRGDQEKRCEEAAKDDPSLDLQACLDDPSLIDDKYRLKASLVGGRSSLRAGSPLRLELETDFSADISCKLSPADMASDDTHLKIGPQGAATVRVHSATRKRIPQRGGPVLSAPHQAGTYTVSCQAISASTFALFQRTLGDAIADDHRDLLASRFAQIRFAPVATASFSIEITDL